MMKTLSESASALVRLQLGDMEAAVHAEGSWKVQLDCNGVSDFADSKWSDPSGLQACYAHSSRAHSRKNITDLRFPVERSTSSPILKLGSRLLESALRACRC